MKIYTSYYANLSNLTKAGIVPISISRFTPKWAKPIVAAEMMNLAPTPEMLRMGIPEYTKRFKVILKNADVREIVQFIRSVAKDKDVALLCYEKPEDFCHRHLVGEWINDYVGRKVVREWTPPVTPVEPPKPKSPVQGSLF